MAKLDSTGLKHYIRAEEKSAIKHLEKLCPTKQLSVYGCSGTGKTEIINHVVTKLLKKDLFSDCFVLYFDANELNENSSKDIFYNMLIYKMLQQRKATALDKTQVCDEFSFLSFLKASSYKESLKVNIKKAIIASLSIIPTVGNGLYNILNIPIENAKKEYQDNQIIFGDYLQYLSKKSKIILIIDNIQCVASSILIQLNTMLQQINDNIYFITSYTLKSDEDITRQLLLSHQVFSDHLFLEVKSLSLEEFEKICFENLLPHHFYDLKKRIEYFYALVQYGNLREIDEFVFQIRKSGIESINDTPTVQGIRALDEIKKDIIDLTSLFPNGIKISFIERIIKYNYGCTEVNLRQSISSLCKTKYIIIGENDVLHVQHEKITVASRHILESSVEEERFSDLLKVCEKVFMELAYEDISDVDFIFCINGLMEIKIHFDLVRHIGILEKYISILYETFHYSQVCAVYRDLVKRCGEEIIVAAFFSIRSIIQVLDSYQKSSNFDEGLFISNQLDRYYNMNIYKAKFLLQTYHYQEAIDILSKQLTDYERWSIYLNALAHLREDKQVHNYVTDLVKHNHQYQDIEYYYIILRNTGHLFDFDDAISNLNSALSYFVKIQNDFIKATCLNNIGILYLYKMKTCNDIETARTFFTSAKKLLSDLQSNEEYQPLFNLGVCYFCEGNYEMAMQYYDRAFETMPQSLTFDRLKLENNIMICKFMSSEITSNECRKELMNKYEEARQMPDPWLKFLYNYNLNLLNIRTSEYKEILSTDYIGDRSKYGLYIKKEEIPSYLIGISPHWRY